MGKLHTIYIDKFDGGMTNDPQDKRANVARITKHIDNYTRPHSFAPYTDIDFNPATDPNSSANFAAYKIRKFIYTGTAWYGLGVQSTTVPAIYTKATIGAAWALGDVTGDYGSLTALGTNSYNVPQFIQYQGYLYGIDGGGWWKYGIAETGGTPGWTRLVDTANYLNACQPIVHSKDDIMYTGGGAGTATGHLLRKNNSGTWSAALSFSIYSFISSLSEYGNYLAIAVNSPNDKAHVYLWDRDSSLTTLTEKIDWGSGTIKWIRNIGGTLIGCSILQPTGLATNPTLSFKYYNGSTAVEFAQFTCTSATVYGDTQLYNNIVYFMAEVVIDGETLSGIWKVVKHQDGHLSVSFDRLPKLDTIPDTGTLYGFLRTGDYFHVAAQYSASYVVSKTLTTYGTTCDYDFPKFDGDDISQTKKLVKATLMTEPLGASEAVILKYKADADSSYKIIFVNTTDNSIRHTAINIEARAATMTIANPAVVTQAQHGLSAGDEISFTTTGALPTGVEADTKYYVIATGLGTNSLQFSTSVGGSAVVTTGTQSGVHTLHRTKDQLPQFKQISFSIEPTGAVVTGLKFIYEDIDDDL